MERDMTFGVLLAVIVLILFFLVFLESQGMHTLSAVIG